MKQNKQQKMISMHYNSISLGSIVLESSNLSIDELLQRAVAILNEPTLKEYLAQLKLSSGLGSASYTG